MKIFISLYALFFINLLHSQNTPQTPPDTEIYLFNLKKVNDKTLLTDAKNISNNEGYDNQPYFLDDTYLLFSSNRNGQNDIAKYYMNYDSKIWLNFTPGSEYSPIKIPGQDAISAINLQTDGTQKLYKYSLGTGEGEVLIDNLVIGYQMWYDEETLITSVLENDMLNLYMTDIPSKKHTKLADKVGRSLHRVPNSDKISYISKTNTDEWEIRSMDITTGKSKLIFKALKGSEDFIWLDNGKLIMGLDSKLFINSGNSWREWADLKENGITNITRLAINDDESKVAIVGESNGAIITNTDSTEISESSTGESSNSSISSTRAGEIVQQHIAPYNTGDLEGFLKAFDEDIVIGRFPTDILFKGKEKMKENYSQYFKNNKNLSVSVNKRITLGNYVIDEELSTQNMETHRQVTIYQTGDEKIKTAYFIQNNESLGNEEQIVNKQLEAYNRRNIEEFMATYSDDVKLYNYLNELRTDGAQNIRKTYSDFFERTPDLRAVIKDRILIGNKVIDHEQVTINGKQFNAIAIYEVENNKISRVTFIQ